MREKEIGDKRASTNKILGKKRRRNSDEKNVEMIKEINLKLNMFRRENNRLRMSLKWKEEKEMNTSELPIDSDASDETSSVSEVLMKIVSPDAKKRAKYRLKLDPPAADSVKRDLRLDRVSIPSEKKSYTQLKVEEFMLQDVNSIVVPDIKASNKNLRYMLMSRRDLHQKYLVDMDHSCSYEQFCRYIPNNIIKPKSEDWGTCLC